MAGMRALFEQDWRNIEAGLYRAPPALPADLKAALTRSVLFFRDVPALDRRRMARGHSDVLTPDRQARYPRYYLQNFHYQTDGWLSDHSAKIYDTQVETLFTGAADAMRRQALVPLRAATKGRDQRKLHLLDLACGTGRFLARVKENYPRLNVTGLETAATARLITLLQNSGCYQIVERSELVNILAQQGLESMEPEALARAAGAGFVITGAVTRATIARPGVSLLGVSVGNVTAEVAVDVRATDLVTGTVVVSQTGVGEAQRANFAITNLPVGTISFNDPTYEPLLADAADGALAQVVASIRQRF